MPTNSVVGRWTKGPVKIQAAWFGPDLQIEKNRDGQSIFLNSDLISTVIILEREAGDSKCVYRFCDYLPHNHRVLSPFVDEQAGAAPFPFIFFLVE